MAEHELPDPGTLAYTLSEAVADEHGDDAQDYLVRFMDGLLTLEPGLREHFSDALLGEIKEEVVRRDPHDSFATVELIEDIENDWRQES